MNVAAMNEQIWKIVRNHRRLPELFALTNANQIAVKQLTDASPLPIE